MIIVYLFSGNRGIRRDILGDSKVFFFFFDCRDLPEQKKIWGVGEG